MKKSIALIRLCLAVALCAIGMSAPAAADDVPTATPAPRVGPELRSMYDVIQEKKAASIVTADNAASPNGAASEVPAPVQAPRAAPQARSYPRTFNTYDGLVEYATDIAITQQASNHRLAEVTAREEAAAAALADVFDPRVRGGLLQSRSDLIDNASLATLQTQLAASSEARRQLLAQGAVIAPVSSWRIPLVGEDTQDFGPTPYWFEPARTYQGTYYPHFHDGTDIAAPWGTPILAPAWGVVTFSGRMGDGAMVVVIAHDDGLVSLYAHLEDRFFPPPVKAGDAVQAGDRIGNVGLSGITTGPHVHWSVWRNGEPIDPLSMIRS